jgi:hypothetical protein
MEAPCDRAVNSRPVPNLGVTLSQSRGQSPAAVGSIALGSSAIAQWRACPS